MRVHGPDGRVWDVARRPEAPGLLARLLPGTVWLVEARTDDETRLWRAGSRSDATQLVSAVAMALRTGSASPAGELDAGDVAASRAPSDDDESAS